MPREDRIIAVDCNAMEWLSVPRPNEPEGLPAIRYRTVMPGGDGLPQVHLTEYEPGHVEPRHRHPEDEVLTIFEGELIIEGQSHPAPSVLYVSRGALYGPLKAGAAGAKFFRVAWNEKLLARTAAA
jgi:hypothetical protein